MKTKVDQITRLVLFLALLVFIPVEAFQIYFRFPQDQHIEGPFRITTEWQTIRFDSPLEIDREGLQSLHLVVDSKIYAPLRDIFKYEFEDTTHGLCLLLCPRRKSDGALITVNVVLIGNEGQMVHIYPLSRGGYPKGDGMGSIGFHTFAGIYNPAPPFPTDIGSFRAVRIRSNIPFTVEHLWWNMDSHPESFDCGSYCSWWDELFS